MCGSILYSWLNCAVEGDIGGKELSSVCAGTVEGLNKRNRSLISYVC